MRGACPTIAGMDQSQGASVTDDWGVGGVIGVSGPFASVMEHARTVAAPEGRSLRHALPWAFVVVAAVLVALLAVNEGLLSRLEVRR